MSIRVLHLIGGGEVGGAEQNVLNLLDNFQQERVSPSLCCLIKNSPFASLARSHGTPTKIFPMRFSLDLFPIIPLVRLCRKDKVQLIHCHGIRANFLGRIAAKLITIPCISTIHSKPENDYTSPWKGKLALYLDTLTLPFSSGVITVSSDLRRLVSLHLKNKGSTLPLNTIYNGMAVLDFSNKDELRSHFRNKWDIPQNCTVIGTIGRLHPVKGQVFLVEALKLLSKEFSDLHLLIIGEGPLHAELEDLLTSYRLPHTMTGYLSSAWQALPAMDLFVLPSLSEGMGLVLLEAAQAQIPIVASRIGGIPEFLADNSDALLVSPADPLELTLACSRILKDSNLAKNLVENARKRAGMYTVEKMAAETTEFYEQVLAKGTFLSG